MAEIYDIADQFRAALLTKERAAAVRLVQAYGQAWKALQANIDEVTRKIEAARAAGEEVNADWLRRQARYKALLDQVAVEIAKFANLAKKEITKEQRAAVDAARSDAERLLQASTGSDTPPGVDLTFNRLPAAAVRAQVGFLSDGSPLASLLNQLGPAARKSVEASLLQAVALGHNPRKTATAIKDALGGNLTRALRIARTETIRSYREATHQTFQANADTLDGWIWNASLSGRTCFPVGTLVQTDQGEIPIEQVCVGDRVLTHRGRFQQVVETLTREYSGQMVLVETSEGAVNATAEHPFYVRRNGEMQWVEADNLLLDDQPLRLVQNGKQSAPHFLSNLTVKRTGIYSNNLVAASEQNFIFPVISVASLVVPVRLIDFEHGVNGGQVEVHRIAPAFDHMLLLERDSACEQDQSDVPFWFCFSGEPTVALRRAEASIVLLCRPNSEFRLARRAGNGNNWTATQFRTVAPDTAGTSIKKLFTSLAGPFCGGCNLTLKGAVESILLSWVSKSFTAKLTGRSIIEGDSSTLSRAVSSRSSSRRNFKYHAALQAVEFLGRERVASATAMWRPLLMGAVARLGAENAASALGMRWRQGERCAALLALFDDLTIEARAHRLNTTFLTAIKPFLLQVADANPGSTLTNRADLRNHFPDTFDVQPFHCESISRLSNHYQPSITVYNLEVEEDHSYIANGFAVHNCAACIALHGTFHKLDERMASHVSCRCSQVPRSKSWEELGITGVPDTRPPIQKGSDWFAAQPEDVQRGILGSPAALEAYKKGEVKLEDFVGRRDSTRWGASYYALSLGPAKAGRGQFPVNAVPVPSAPKAIKSIAKKPARKKKAAEPAAAPAASAFPASIDHLQIVKALGGSTGAQLVRDPVTGKQYVLKRGASPDHLREEYHADQAYAALGVPVPKAQLFETKDGPVKLAEFIEGKPLSALKGAARKKADAALQKHFAADALLGNWDVVGLQEDNVLVAKDGTVYRIDNGGSLRFRAQGARKTDAQWNQYPSELWSLRDPKVNPQTAKAFGALSLYDLEGQIHDLLGKEDALKAVLPPEVHRVVSQRLAQMKDVAHISKTFREDQWVPSYTDGFAKHVIGLRAAGLVDKMPQRFTLQDENDVKPRDENGRQFDHFRGEKSLVGDLAQYLARNGGAPQIIFKFAGEQAGSSWSPTSTATKVFWAQQRTVSDSEYWWGFNGKQAALDDYSALLRQWGDDFVRNTWQIQHAFHYEMLGRIEMVNNDRENRTVQMIRTEDSVIVKKVAKLKKGETGAYPRGAHESCSIFAPTFPFGHETLVMEVPHHRVTYGYFLAQFDGSHETGLASDFENEFLFLTHGIKATYLGTKAKPKRRPAR